MYSKAKRAFDILYINFESARCSIGLVPWLKTRFSSNSRPRLPANACSGLWQQRNQINLNVHLWRIGADSLHYSDSIWMNPLSSTQGLQD